MYEDGGHGPGMVLMGGVQQGRRAWWSWRRGSCLEVVEIQFILVHMNVVSRKHEVRHHGLERPRVHHQHRHRCRSLPQPQPVAMAMQTKPFTVMGGGRLFHGDGCWVANEIFYGHGCQHLLSLPIASACPSTTARRLPLVPLPPSSQPERDAIGRQC